MDARLEMGDVLLTASIVQVVRQVVLGVVTGNVAVADQIGKGVARNGGEFGSLAE